MTSSTNTVKANSLTETGFTYDERGNITGFARYDAKGQSVRYTMTYSTGNRLSLARTDKGGLNSFSYDANGNQTTAPNNQTITYNYLNQPQLVKSGSTVKHKFSYLADGRKFASLDKIKSADNINKDGGLAYVGSSVFIIKEGKYDGFESTNFSAGRIVRSGSDYAVQYHITDHLGSVRVVLDQNKNILEQNDYYPFGLRHPNTSLKTTANRYRYNGKEEVSATATSDYGARQYSAEFCQWMQVDPLSEKYYSWSPYNFCVGNPLKYVDPNGKKIRFANGSSTEFKTSFAQAVQHLNSHSAGGMLAELEKSNTVYFLSVDDGKGSRFNSKEKTIYWNPTEAVLTTNFIELSPTSVLNHEIDHALQFDKNPQQFRKDANSKNDQYDTDEEKRVITGSEQETAKKLEEIKDGEVTREDHKGTLYETISPTSTQSIYEIIVKP